MKGGFHFMKSIRRGLALFMAGLLAITPLRVNATEVDEVTVGNALEMETYVSENEVSVLTTEDVEDAVEETADMIIYNTGNHEYSVASSDTQGADAVFAEDGSYTINIPEEDPFFPYEVQFKCGDSVTYEWFMNPNDSVQVGGHTFRVNANFTGEVLTQLTLNIAGSTVVVYPEEKKYINETVLDEESLLPLHTTKIEEINLSNYTPMDLKRVAVSEALAGYASLNTTDKIAWCMDIHYSYDGYPEDNNRDEDYIFADADGYFDLSYPALCGWETQGWTMIITDNQLKSDATRYDVPCCYTKANAANWLVPVAYLQRGDGTRSEITPIKSKKYVKYGGYAWNASSYGMGNTGFSQYMNIDEEIFDVIDAVLATDKDAGVYWGYKINDTFSNKNKYASLKAYNGKYTSVSEAVQGLDVTSLIFAEDMTQKDAGYQFTSLGNSYTITLVSFDESGNALACMPVWFSIDGINNSSDNHSFVLSTTGTHAYTSTGFMVNCDDSYYILQYDSNSGVETLKISLYRDTPTYYEYVVKLSSSYYKNIDAIYLGYYDTKEAAENAGAVNLKSDFTGDGYKANYDGGLPLTLVKSDGTVQKANISVYESSKTRESGATGVTFYGFKDKDGNIIRAYQLPNSPYDDNYADQSYLTYLVDASVDTSHLKPLFTCDEGINLYSSDGNTLEVSGKSEHDFSNEAIAYTSSAENKINQQNYWLKVIKVAEGSSALYVSNFANKDAVQYYGDGVLRGTREIISDDYHDIFVINYGTESIDNISVELNSDALTLDDYWTYNGNYSLAGANPETFGTTTETINSDGSSLYRYTKSATRPSNISKLRLHIKEDYKGDIVGTLTIKSGNKTLVELTLTGTTKNASITTTSIRTAVKYVPFGMMIQNDNKYKSNKVSYYLKDGKLPEGVVIKPNGELYGVPLESGEFRFTIRLYDSTGNSDEKTFTWTVLDNTDQDVDNQNDTGYSPTEKVPYALSDGSLNDEYLYVSPGTYDQFIAVYLDGQKLISGKDYTSESGSTRITIKGQTLASKGNGTHTIGVEFRTEQKTGELKASAQNYTYNTGTSTIVTPPSESETNETTVPSTNQNPAPASNPTPAPSNTVVAISTSYTVQSGDTLWKIAQKVYGNGALWNKIYADNKASIKDPNKIYAGQVIMIYPIVGDGTVITSGNSTGNYVVQSGDTLWKIAKKKYGRSSKWRKIYEANKSTMSDPNKLRVGQVIVLPD